MSHLFSCLSTLISCHVCSCRILQSSTPQIGMFLPSTTQPGTDACTRFHFASPLSFVSHPYGFLSHGFCCVCLSILFSSFLFSHLMPLYAFSLMASLHILSSNSHHPTPPLSSCLPLHTCLFILHSPTHLLPLLFHSTLSARSVFQMLCEGFGSGFRSLE